MALAEVLPELWVVNQVSVRTGKPPFVYFPACLIFFVCPWQKFVNLVKDICPDLHLCVSLRFFTKTTAAKVDLKILYCRALGATIHLACQPLN